MTKYRVFFTPRTKDKTYGDETEVTDFVFFDGLPNIKRAIDSQDYDIGVFTYDDLQLKCANVNGYFNDEMDYPRSFFKFSRDLCKVRVQFENDVGTSIVFRGLINEEATRVNATGDEITFRVLSRDSVIRNTKIAGGTVSNGTMVSTAINSILSDPTIASVLTVDEININPDFDFSIDDGSKFDNKTVREGLNKLLFASNSVIIIDDTDTVFVRSRDEDTERDIINLYGPYDLKRRQNTIAINDYNLGRQRMFTSVKVNTSVATSAALVDTYGFRQKVVAFDFITSTITALAIADRVMNEFKAPKVEFSVTVPTFIVRNARILDRVSVDWPLRIVPPAGKFLPIVGSAVIGDAETPLPNTYGSLQISPNMGFKIIEIVENSKEFETMLKLRQIGKDVNDGWFITPDSNIIGFAIIGSAVLGGPGDEDDTWNPSVVGAAKIGSTEVA